MIKIDQYNINLIKNGNIICYNAGKINRLYKIINMSRSTFSYTRYKREPFYSDDNNFVHNDLFSYDLMDSNFYLLNDEEKLYYSKLVIFK